MNGLCYLFLIFLTGCLAGWVYEEIFYWITEGLLRNRGVLYGPWLPIYGVGGIVIPFIAIKIIDMILIGTGILA